MLRADMQWQIPWCHTKYRNVICSDHSGRIGKAPRQELYEHGRISGACSVVALGIISQS